MSNHWVRMSTLSPALSAQWDIELEWILALRMCEGVRIDVGFSAADGVASDPNASSSSSVFDNLKYVLSRLAATGLKVQLGIGGEGPPMSSAWKAYNYDNSPAQANWLHVKRPPLGRNSSGTITYDIVNRTRALKNIIIQTMFDIYEAAGLDPFTHCWIELGNEPAIGGAGAPPETGNSFYGTGSGNSGITFSTSIGLWDSAAEATNLTTKPWLGCSFLEYFTRECDGLDTLGLPCVAPSFTCEHLFNDGSWTSPVELDTFDRAVTIGGIDKKWMDLIRVQSCLSVALSNYYNAFNPGSTGCLPELYVWPSCGAQRFAETAVWGFDGEGAESYDGSCAALRLAKIRAVTRLAGAKIIVSEFGVKPGFAGMTDDPSTNSVGSMLPNYYENYRLLGETGLALRDELLKLGIERAIYFTLTNTDSAWGSRFGIFKSDIELFDGGGDLVTGATDKTFTSALAWAEQAGLPLPGDGPSASIAFWGTGYAKGTEEEVPTYG